MQPQRYLVVGLAKTGTTVISKTIQNTCGIRAYALEPKEISFFEAFPNQYRDAVVKILFDHWRDRPHLLDAILGNELKTDFTRTIFITRDPRAEVISRLHYAAYSYFQRQEPTPEAIETWLAIFRRKEADPENVSLHEMVEYLRGHFRVFGRRGLDGPAGFGRKYAAFIGARPELHRDLVRYEDFIAGNLQDHPCAELFSGSREVGKTLERTRRAGDETDWASFVLDSDRDWLHGALGPTMQALGYSEEVPDGPKAVAPERSSLYVERLIAEACERRNRAPSGRPAWLEKVLCRLPGASARSAAAGAKAKPQPRR